MVVFPNAKINLGLHVTEKRDDGYHEIETCFYPVPLCDVLEIIPAESVSFHQTGLQIPGNEDDNLVLRAYSCMSDALNIPPVSIHLHKVIPMGAGLGGGSSDGAFMLKALNSLFKTGLADSDLEVMAAELGSDCPFFIHEKPAIGTGTGTTLSAANLSLEGWHIAIVHPGIHISTAEAYASLTPDDTRESILSYLQESPDRWEVKNDFTATVYPLHPEIEKIEQGLMDAGAAYACMSGSGSAVFGLFREPPKLKFPPTFFVWQGLLS